MRIGFGFDVHQLGENEELWLGGIKIPHTKGTIGHSDADVLLHAICDAILGALALGDIGKHFPDTDNSFKGIDSKILLQKEGLRIQIQAAELRMTEARQRIQGQEKSIDQAPSAPSAMRHVRRAQIFRQAECGSRTAPRWRVDVYRLRARGLP